MASDKFTLDESMSASWLLLIDNFWKYLGLLGLAGFLMVLPDIASSVVGFYNADFIWFAAFLTIMGMVLKVMLALGIYNIQLRIVTQQPVSSNDFWTPSQKFWAFIGATVIYVWVVGFGLCMFVIPGLIFGIMFQFYPYFIVEHRLGPIKALKASAAITSGAMWELFFLGLILWIIEAMAPLAFIIGLIPAAMFSKLTQTHVYKTLLDNTPPDQLPFAYAPGAKAYSRAKSDEFMWQESMGYDDPAPAAAIGREDEGGRLKTPVAEPELQPVSEGGDVDNKSEAVDNKPAENDKSPE